MRTQTTLNPYKTSGTGPQPVNVEKINREA